MLRKDSLLPVNYNEWAKEHSIDQPREFFEIMLGPTLENSHGYFLSPDDDLDTAQEQKLAHICGVLDLRPGQHVLDIGCCFGGFMIYAAKNYGVQANGVDLVEPYIAIANERIAENNLGDRCYALACDYRDIVEDKKYDVVTSICMSYEKKSEGFFNKMYSLLKPGGQFFILTKTLNPEKLAPIYAHNNTYFPISGTTETLDDIRLNAGKAGFEIKKVEDYSDSYKFTYKKCYQRLYEHYYKMLKYIDPQALQQMINMFRIEYEFLAENEIIECYLLLMSKPLEEES